MVDYDPHHFWRQLLQLRGSMVRDIVGRVLMLVVWSAVVVAIHRYVRNVSAPSTVHALGGLALSLLLVFRTNSSYDRFWEGRKLWGGIVNETRNLARSSGVFLRDGAADLYQRLVLWTIAFPYACTAALRGEVDMGPELERLPKEDVERVRAAQHVPLAVALEMTKALDEGRKRGLYPEYVQMQIDQNVQQLIDYIGGCERIHKTPVPFAYMVHVRRAIVVYCITLPFVLVEPFGWMTVLATFLVAYLVFGIEEIGVEVEDPFGRDDNDLPLERICETIRNNLKALLPPSRPT
ncbi:MAG TPA: bestrophin family protein [Myxococcaceae bacterium]|nr:bestrophin family protein [Myxococcaceae bacterium]